MTQQETIWINKYVWVTGIVSKSGKVHQYVAKYVGRGGFVEREAKNGMLQVRFTHNGGSIINIPAGCLTLYTEVK